MAESKEGIFPASKGFQRHLKRYILAPEHRLAAIVPPELSHLCREELAALGVLETEITEAGVEFRGDFVQCYLANLWLRTASRILCRLPSFRAGAVEELFNRVSSVRWELWLNANIPLRIETHVEHSRIEHEGLVADTVLAGVRERFQSVEVVPAGRWAEPSEEESAGTPSAAWKQKILVRLKRNHCVISLDTTGAHLHHRGYRLKHSGAPLRETLGAAILMKCGWRGDSPLVDGMCGAGTVPIEGALIARNLPPGLLREYLFQRLPAFKGKTWEYLCRVAKERALLRPQAAIIGVDHDPAAVAVARENARRAGVEQNIEWHSMDFFSFHPVDWKLRPGLLVLNPPYGKRITGEGRALYARLGAHLRLWFAGWQIAVLAPDRSHAASLKIPRARLWKISHGGIPVFAVIGRV